MWQQAIKKFNRRLALNEVSASLTVFLVSLPLSMGIALASGMPLFSGLVAAAVGGIVAGSVGGAPLLVSGPAAGLSVIVVDLAQRYGAAAVALATLCAGILQLGLGAAGVARFATAISPAILHGMMGGIGILIATAQLHVMMGFAPGSNFWQNLNLLPQRLPHINIAALALGLSTIAILYAWPLLPLRRLRLPASLGAVGATTALAYFFHVEVPYVHIPRHVTFSLPSLDIMPLGALVSGALVVAMIASTESLLSAVAVDKLHHGPRARLDRELLGQGAANFVSGLLGGLPITGVVVRSTANVEAGAKTRFSTILHGFWIIVAFAFGAPLMDAVPLAALGGLLLVIGIRLLNARAVATLRRHGELFVYVTTVVGIVAVNLLAGIGLGLAVALLRLLWRLGRTQVVTTTHDKYVELRIQGALTFLGVPALVRAFAALPPKAEIRIFGEVPFIDHAAREALDSFCDDYRAKGGRVIYKQAAAKVGEKLQKGRAA